MKNLRQELIEFCAWQDRELWDEDLEGYAEEVDNYLKQKSINSAQSEALSVGNNEQAKEDKSPCCNYRIENKHGADYCGKCDALIVDLFD